jgi:serine/threonine protein kinase
MGQLILGNDCSFLKKLIVCLQNFLLHKLYYRSYFMAAVVYHSTQNLGVFQNKLVPITEALHVVEWNQRTQVGEYVVLDRDSDPKFPCDGGGKFKKALWAVSDFMKKGDFTVHVALRSQAGCPSFQREKRAYEVLKGADGINFDYFIANLCNQGDLYDARMSVEHPLTISEADLIGLKVAKALLECQKRGIIWRDAKLENVLVHRNEDGSLEIVLADFGFAFIMQEGSEEEAYKSCGSPQYISPESWAEICKHKRLPPADYSTDLFGLGSILFALVKGHLPCYKQVKGPHKRVDLKMIPEYECADLGIYSKAIKELVYRKRIHQGSLESSYARIHNIFAKTYPGSGLNQIETPVIEKPAARWKEMEVAV